MDAPSGRRTFFRVAGILQGVTLIVSSLLAAPLAWFALDRIAYAANKQDVEILGFQAMFLEHPWRVAVLAVPAFIFGIATLLVPRGKMVTFVLGLTALFAIVYVVAHCFIAMIGPLYTYQEL